MTKRALGRGLSALLSDSAPTTSEELLDIDINLIDANATQPRTHFNEARLEELAQSIQANGIVQPILVRRRGGRYQIVAGERRWRAAQRAGLSQVPAVVREVPDDKLLELALIENIQRQELNAIEEAYAYKRLIETLGITQETVAQRVGRDRSFITNHLRLLRLPEDLQRHLEDEKISVGHARALLAIDDESIQRRVVQTVIEQSLSVRETERTIKRIINGQNVSVAITPTSASKRGDANIKAAEAKLRRRLSTQVRVVPSGLNSGGKIEIEYYSEADLNRVYELLMNSKESSSSI